MRCLAVALVFMCLAANSNGGKRAPGLKVTFSLFNNELPKTLTAAVADGWVLVERASDALLPTLDMYCPSDDVSVCVLFLDIGYVAGLQVSYPISQLTNMFPSDLSTQGFKKWTPAHGAFPGEEHWYHTQFYVSEETLTTSTAAERSALVKSGETLYEGGVWVTNKDGETLTFFKSNGDFSDTIFTEQGCVPLMGTHYYFNMSSTTDCNKLYPWFGLVQDGQLIGTGLRMYAERIDSDPAPYLEYPPAFSAKVSIIDGPDCIYDLAEDPGLISLHIYYIDNVKSVLCTVTDIVTDVWSLLTN